MTDYRVTGVHQLNQWLWSKLKDMPEFSAYAQGSPNYPLIPIVSTQQQPEFMNIAGGAPFIAYNYTTAPLKTVWGFQELAVYVIYDNQADRLRAIHGYMVDLLRRMDISAREVNGYLSADNPFGFHYIEVTQATGPDEFLQEGGRQGAMIALRYEFSRDDTLSTG